MAFFLNTIVLIVFFQNSALFWVKKTASFFRKIFLRKYLQNHNIGPKFAHHLYKNKVWPGANSTILSRNANALTIHNATSSPLRFGINDIFFYLLWKTL
jgi:hypothetical protein